MKIFELVIMKIQIIGYRVLKQFEKFLLWRIKRKDWFKEQIKITFAVCLLLILLMIAFLLAVDSRLCKWHRPTTEIIEICPLLYVEVTHL